MSGHLAPTGTSSTTDVRATGVGAVRAGRFAPVPEGVGEADLQKFVASLPPATADDSDAATEAASRGWVPAAWIPDLLRLDMFKTTDQRVNAIGGLVSSLNKARPSWGRALSTSMPLREKVWMKAWVCSLVSGPSTTR